MYTFKEEKIIPYSAQQMYDLIQDINQYKEFLPWCTNSVVLQKNADYLIADLTVGYSFFSETFRSKVICTPPMQIETQQIDGPLDQLASLWKIEPLSENSCKVFFDIHFAIKSRFLDGILKNVFEKAATTMIESFTKRADLLYQR